MKIIYVGAEVGYYAMKDVVGGRSECEHVEAEPGALGEALKGADALLDASMKVKITNQMIEDAVALKIISCATTGSDHIERPFDPSAQPEGRPRCSDEPDPCGRTLMGPSHGLCEKASGSL